MKPLSNLLRHGAVSFLSVTALLVGASLTHAATVSLTGSLDPNNPNDMLLVPFTFSGGTLVAQSYGFGGSAAAPGGTNAAGTVIAAGGFDSYLSLFLGTGPAATFLASNDDGTCPPGDGAVACRDSQLDLSGLAAGDYTLVLSVFNNFSFAENLGSGTLGDGFIQLGSYFNNDLMANTTSAFALDLTGDQLVVGSPTPALPEPASLALVLTALAVAGAASARQTSAFNRRRGDHQAWDAPHFPAKEPHA